MNPCSFSTRRTSFFSFEYGTRVLRAELELALRMDVRRSAIGSVILMAGTPSPARLPHPRDLSLGGQHAEADPAHLELPVVGPSPPAQLAAVVPAGGELGRSELFDSPG